MHDLSCFSCHCSYLISPSVAKGFVTWWLLNFFWILICQLRYFSIIIFLYDMHCFPYIWTISMLQVSIIFCDDDKQLIKVAGCLYLRPLPESQQVCVQVLCRFLAQPLERQGGHSALSWWCRSWGHLINFPLHFFMSQGMDLLDNLLCTMVVLQLVQEELHCPCSQWGAAMSGALLSSAIFFAIRHPSLLCLFTMYSTGTDFSHFLTFFSAWHEEGSLLS